MRWASRVTATVLAEGCARALGRVLGGLLAPLLACSGAVAATAEQTEFHAWTPQAGPIKVVFFGDPQPWSEGAHLFGSRDDRRFAWCWAPVRGGTPLSFKCTPGRGMPAAIVWRYLRPLGGPPAHDDNSPLSAEYRRIARAARIGDGTHTGDGTWVATFTCRQGCRPGVPRYVFEVAYGESGK
jgi:hypothetical protein